MERDRKREEEEIEGVEESCVNSTDQDPYPGRKVVAKLHHRCDICHENVVIRCDSV